MYCIDLQLPCQGSKSQAFGSSVKNTCVVQRLQTFSRHTDENNIVLQVKEIFYMLLVYGIPHDKLLNVWQRSLALQPYSRFF